MQKYRRYKWHDGKELQLGNKTIIMGILNGTPDSFSDGGKYNTPETARNHMLQLIQDGADIVDFGVESTRPGYIPMSIDDELERMRELLPSVLEVATIPVSIDTYRAKTADYALSQGAHILNDIWGLQYDPEIAAVAAQYKVPVVIMHNQKEEKYGDIMEDIKAFFFRSVNIAEKAGILHQNIWLDPGIGFGKNTAQNIEIIQRLDEITMMEYPVLLAPSRKRFIGEILQGVPPTERDEGTGAVVVAGIVQNVNIVRVHNVKMISPIVRVADVLTGVE